MMEIIVEDRECVRFMCTGLSFGESDRKPQIYYFRSSDLGRLKDLEFKFWWVL